MKYFKLSFLITILCVKINYNFLAQNINSTQYKFIENKGQIIDQNYQPNTSVMYLHPGKDYSLHLKSNGFSYELKKVIKDPSYKILIGTIQ